MACRYDYMGNQTMTAAFAAANRTKLGIHGERLSGYDASADLTTQAAYDMVGNNTSVTDGRGTTTTYTYDALSRLTGVSQPLSTGVTATTAYAYDQSVTGGVANTVTSANGVTTTSVFDQSGRKLRDVVTDPDDAEKSVTTSYAYGARAGDVRHAGGRQRRAVCVRRGGQRRERAVLCHRRGGDA